jgi:hypothetical protein
MRRVIIESPFAASTKEEKRDNIKYAQECMLDSLKRGEAPFVSHLLYTQVLNDDDKEERKMGISAGFAWQNSADAVVVYLDKGLTAGMKLAIELTSMTRIKIEYRSLYNQETDRG